jgi:hypothetical protein
MRVSHISTVPHRPQMKSIALELASRMGGARVLVPVDEIAAWEHDRNANHAKANWQFTTPTAGIKLKHLYPSI